MGGYVKDSADAKTNILNLITKLDNTIKPIEIWYTADSAIRYPRKTSAFSADISTTTIATQRSSQLHKIIADIASRNDSNDVSILVSDCILSFPDADVKNNREINKVEAPNALKNNIYTTFSDLKKKGFAASVYAFTSKFYGTYYDYQNKKTSLKGTRRPYYIWIIGEDTLLKKFDSTLTTIPGFMPEERLYFGINDQPVSKFDIIPQVEKKGGNFMPEKSGLSAIEFKGKEALQFCLALNLDKLPAYAKDINYLKSNIMLETNGCTATTLVKLKQSCDRSKLKNKKQIEKFENNSHFILINITDMPLETATIHLTLPLKYATWYEQWSTMDDRDITKNENKTFALQHLISGVKEAYESSNKNYIDITIILKK